MNSENYDTYYKVHTRVVDTLPTPLNVVVHFYFYAAPTIMHCMLSALNLSKLQNRDKHLLAHSKHLATLHFHLGQVLDDILYFIILDWVLKLFTSSNKNWMNSYTNKVQKSMFEKAYQVNVDLITNVTHYSHKHYYYSHEFNRLNALMHLIPWISRVNYLIRSVLSKNLRIWGSITGIIFKAGRAYGTYMGKGFLLTPTHFATQKRVIWTIISDVSYSVWVVTRF